MIDTTAVRMTLQRVARIWPACWLSSIAGLTASAAADRIHLDADMLTNLSGLRPATELVDEQDFTGDPRTGDAQQPKTCLFNGRINAELYYPLSVVIDLGVVHDLTEICRFDLEGQGKLTADAWDAGTRKRLVVDRRRRWTSRTTECPST